MEVGQNLLDLLTGENGGDSPGHLGPNHSFEPGNIELEDFAVEEEDAAKRLILRGRADFAYSRKVREEGGDLDGTHIDRMPLAMKQWHTMKIVSLSYTP